MKYIVNIKEVHNLPVEVEANSPEEARMKVIDSLANNDELIDYDQLEYSHTQDCDTWDVSSANI